MLTFAVIEEGIVTNLIVAETKELAESVTGQTCVESTEYNTAHIGLAYDGVMFEQPSIEESTNDSFYVGAPVAEPEE
jgi:hypothetical protein